MENDPTQPETEPSLQTVLDALGDPDCRAILTETTESMTATEINETCDIPESTLYRKLELLRRAALVREIYDIHPEGGRITRYVRDFDDVEISAGSEDGFSFRITRPPRSREGRLADMWSKLGDEL